MKETVGFIGLGVMGRSMARRIQSSLGSLVVWNRTREKARDLESTGALVADSPAALARVCTIICLCVSDTPDVAEVVFGPGGVYTGLHRGALVIDFSTISASRTEEFAARLAERGCWWMDAPVSGGDVGAREGTLTVMAGGSHEDFARGQAIFKAVGRKIVHMGPAGSGQRAKLANQIAVAGTLASMGEALVFARKSGMDVQKVLDVIGSGAAGSWSLSNYGPRVLRGDFAPGFAASLMAKDLRLVEEAISGLDDEFPVVRRMAEIFEEMVANDDGGLGCHGSAKYLGWEE